MVLHYNGWSEKVTADVPMLMLTTLDENTDAKEVTNNSNDNGNTGNNED